MRPPACRAPTTTFGSISLSRHHSVQGVGTGVGVAAGVSVGVAEVAGLWVGVGDPVAVGLTVGVGDAMAVLVGVCVLVPVVAVRVGVAVGLADAPASCTAKLSNCRP